MVDRLCDRDVNFWIDVIREANMPAVGRQQIGYYPYRFGLGMTDNDVQGLEAGLDTELFLTEFGPTTLEQTNPYYSAFKNLPYCCIWQGQSWPFSTSAFLGSLARLARENRSSVATSEFFQQAFDTYTRTNYEDGGPYTAESHYPTIDELSDDTTNHSENCLHSTYMDNVFTNLLGVVPTFENRLEMRPLVPSNWTHFVVENMPYHGFLFSVLWDSNGFQYSSQPHEAGLTIYANGQMLHHQHDLSYFNVTLPSMTPASIQNLAMAPTYEDILANPNAPHGYPNITADYTFASNGDDSAYEAWKLNDGLLWYDATPDNRWTNNQTSSNYSTINITLPRARTFSSMSFAVYADVNEDNPDDPAAIGRIIDCPGGIQIKDSRTDLVVAERNHWTECRRNALNSIAFSRPSANPSNMTTPMNGTTGQNVTTNELTVTVLNKRYRASAFSELQIWVPTTPGSRYEAEDGLLGTFIGGFEGRARGFNGSVVPESRIGAADWGVRLGESGWVEVAGAQYHGSVGGRGSMTLTGSGNDRATVQMNFSRNHTVSFEGDELTERRVDGVSYLRGPNVVTVCGEEGSVFVDAFEVR